MRRKDGTGHGSEEYCSGNGGARMKTIWLLVGGLLLTWAASCSLNPQPEPPGQVVGNVGGMTGAGGAAGGTAGYPGGFGGFVVGGAAGQAGAAGYAGAIASGGSAGAVTVDAGMPPEAGAEASVDVGDAAFDAPDGDGATLTCNEATQQFKAAIASARACDPNKPNQCARPVDLAASCLTCPGRTFVEQSNADAVQAIDDVIARAAPLKCGNCGGCAGGPPPAVSASCVTDGGAGGASCVDSYGP